MKIQIQGSFAFVPPYLAPAASVYFSAKMINARSIANKSFLLKDLLCREKLDFMFISKIWQRENEVAHLLGLCPGDRSFWGRNAVIFKKTFLCHTVLRSSYISFEMIRTKIGRNELLYGVLIYCRSGSAASFLSDFQESLCSTIKLCRIITVGACKICGLEKMDYLLHRLLS